MAVRRQYPTQSHVAQLKMEGACRGEGELGFRHGAAGGDAARLHRFDVPGAGIGCMGRLRVGGFGVWFRI